MTDSMMSKAATMEIPINSNGDTGTLTEDDGLEQVGQVHSGVQSSVEKISAFYSPVFHIQKKLQILWYQCSYKVFESSSF